MAGDTPEESQLGGPGLQGWGSCLLWALNLRTLSLFNLKLRSRGRAMGKTEPSPKGEMDAHLFIHMLIHSLDKPLASPELGSMPGRRSTKTSRPGLALKELPSTRNDRPGGESTAIPCDKYQNKSMKRMQYGHRKGERLFCPRTSGEASRKC